MEPRYPVIAAFLDGLREGQLLLLPDERRRHLYIVGRSGSGKSTLLYNLALTDMMEGAGLAVIDPHGDLAHDLIDAVPPRRTEQVCYLNAADREYLVGFNPFSGVAPERRALAASGMVSAFKSIWFESWGPRFEWFLYCGLAALLERPDATLYDLPRLYVDDGFRERATANIGDSKVRDFWRVEYPSYNDRYREDAMGPILNKVDQFLASPAVRGIICQRHPKLDLAHAMDNRQILIINLAKGLIGEAPANLLGSLIISHLKHTAMARADRPVHERSDFHVHVDEFQSFGTDAFEKLLSEARKYGICLTLAHQFTQQLLPSVRAAILGNAGTMIAFRVGIEDAQLLAPEFHPLPPEELSDQFPHHAWIKRGQFLAHFPIETQPQQPIYSGRRAVVVERSRRRFGRRYAP